MIIDIRLRDYLVSEKGGMVFDQSNLDNPSTDGSVSNPTKPCPLPNPKLFIHKVFLFSHGD